MCSSINNSMLFHVVWGLQLSPSIVPTQWQPLCSNNSHKNTEQRFWGFFSPCSCEESYTNPAITSCSISAQFCVKPSITNVLLSSSPGALLTGIQSQITPGFQSSSSFPLTTSMQMLYTCWMHRYSHISALIVSTWNNSWHLVSFIFK